MSANVAQIELAGWWERAGAHLLDGLVLLAGAGGVGGIAYASGEPWQAAVGATYLIGILFYAPLMIATRRGQTWGKQALGICVVRPDGRAVGFVRAFLRETIVKLLLNVFVLWWLSALSAAIDKQNRALHDLAVHTRVARIRPVTVTAAEATPIHPQDSEPWDDEPLELQDKLTRRGLRRAQEAT